MTEPILSTRSLSKSFGGLVAVNNVTLDFTPGQVHAIIGPNGAGKTTLINLLSGDLPPSSGSITFKGRNITKLPAFEISRIGFGRSYQKTNIFPQFTCFQNCWLGAQSRLKTSMRFFRPAAGYAEVGARAERALDLCGLAHRRDLPPAQISHGEQRQLEIGMMLATEPELSCCSTSPWPAWGRKSRWPWSGLLRELAKAHTLILDRARHGCRLRHRRDC